MLKQSEIKSYDFNKHLLKDFTKLTGKVGIFGGSCDPVHRDHIGAGEEAEKTKNLDYVVYMLTPQSPLKSKPLFSDEDRTEMLLRAVAGHDNFYVSTLELANKAAEQKDNTYTIDTVELINKLKNPKAEIYFLIGADSLFQIHLWKNFHELLSSVKVVPIQRGLNKEETFKKLKEQNNLTPGELSSLSKNWVNYKTQNSKGTPISSTFIREQLENGQIPIDFLPPLVTQYLSDNFKGVA
jgi:nicotinate-nucleotide adenylyltransferase